MGELISTNLLFLCSVKTVIELDILEAHLFYFLFFIFLSQRMGK